MNPAAVAPRSAAPSPAARLRWSTVALGSVVVTLVRPAAWAVGLAGFLAGPLVESFDERFGVV